VFITGHRAAAWIVPNDCEYIHIPSLDSLLPQRGVLLNRLPVIDLKKEEALKLRAEIINASVRALKPSLLVSDHLPLGKNDELREVVCDANRCLKYVIFRAVAGGPIAALDIMTPKTLDALHNCYSRILVAGDRRTSTVLQELRLDETLLGKSTYIGYVSPKIDATSISRCRLQRGLSERDMWVVCSAGSGLHGEGLLRACFELATQFSRVAFDIVLGPKFPDHAHLAATACLPPNTRLHEDVRGLAILHAAADVVICHGGYNTVIESLHGGASVIVSPTSPRDSEQFDHSQLLEQYLPVFTAKSLDELACRLDRLLANRRASPDHTVKNIDSGGTERFREIALNDLGP
jgi:predicted glycosyltransferase